MSLIWTYAGRVPISKLIRAGAGLTVISEEIYRKDFREIPVNTCHIKIKTYTNEPIAVFGKILVDVYHNSQKYPGMPLIVLEGAGVNLLGRDGLNVIQLDWHTVICPKVSKVSKIHHEFVTECISNEIKGQLDSLMEANSALFQDRIGTIKGYEAKIYIKTDAVPKFTKARNVPVALQNAVDNELDRLITENILKPIPFSPWASPIVIVPKPDGGVRIWGDFKRTVNPNIESEVYPTPSNDEIFSKMEGGEKFSKIDLRQAYLQLELDDEAKKIMVINTNKGLMQYQRMPYGIKPASAIFQCIMDNALVNVPTTGVRTDDILISGRTNDEHLKNLGKVMEILKGMGVTVRKEKCNFFMPEVINLGHIISKDGIRVNPEKTEALNNAPVPRNAKELQSFIGGVNYYASLIWQFYVSHYMTYSRRE